MKSLKSLACVASVVALMGTGASAAVVLTDTFSYPDGNLVGAPGSPWANHSGTTAVTVASGAAVLTQSNSEDVNAALAGAPYASGVLYAGFDVSFSALPGAGAYFAHFKDDGTSIFRGRVFATTTGAASGSFRIGIANGGNTFVAVPTDLSLNTVYRIVTEYDTATAVATVYVNPVTQTGGATATDVTTAAGITTYALRQATGIGTLTLDNLVVATTFEEARVIPEPASLSLLALGGLMLGRRRRA